jgi:hypothetical protein
MRLLTRRCGLTRRGVYGKAIALSLTYTHAPMRAQAAVVGAWTEALRVVLTDRVQVGRRPPIHPLAASQADPGGGAGERQAPMVLTRKLAALPAFARAYEADPSLLRPVLDLVRAPTLVAMRERERTVRC